MSGIVRKSDSRCNLFLKSPDQQADSGLHPVTYPSRLGRVSFIHADNTVHMAYITSDKTIQTVNDPKLGTQQFTMLTNWISALEKHIRPFDEYVSSDINFAEYKAAGFETTGAAASIITSTYIEEHHYNGNENFPPIIRSHDDNGDFDP